jgi:hypothetical protein
MKTIRMAISVGMGKSLHPIWQDGDREGDPTEDHLQAVNYNVRRSGKRKLATLFFLEQWRRW